MQDLSLHLLDIAENSVRAQAKKIIIELDEKVSNNTLCLKISDNGKGMTQQMVQNVVDPFVTTRTTRRVGLGISLLNQNCINASGSLTVNSILGEGTTVQAMMQYDHIDRLPLGDIASSLIILIQGNSHINFIYKHIYENKIFLFDTLEIKKLLGEVMIDTPEIIQWLKKYIRENIDDLYV